MALQKQPVAVNFNQGLDTKTDPWQVQPGKFLTLVNTVFLKGGLLQKRNGFAQLASLPDSTSTYVTTFNGNLTTISNSLNAYSASSSSWLNKGYVMPMDLSTQPLIRNNTNQSQVDSVTSSNGFICMAYTDVTTAGTKYKYAVADSTTGQNIIAPTDFVPTSGTVNGSPRVFLLANNFIIVYSTSTSHLQYVAINASNPTSASAAVDITTSYTGVSTVAFDGVVANNILYLAWNGNDGGGAIRMTYISSNLVQGTAITGTVVANGKSATIVGVCADITQSTPVIWVSFYTTAGTAGYVLAVNPSLASVLAATSIIASGTMLNITCSAQDMVCTVFFEKSNTYSYGASLATNIVQTVTVTQAGVVGSITDVLRSVGLASKSFIYNEAIYVLVAYSSPYQPTYFLTTSAGKIVSKLAYSNGGGYLTLGLPAVTVIDTTANVPYLRKDFVTSVNKDTNVPTGIQTAGVYSQTGIDVATFDFTSVALTTSEIGQNLHLSGAIVMAYDGYSAVEQGFNVYPDNVIVTTSAAGGSIAASTYYYQATYEWSDNQGNIFRSAPSIPVSIVTTGSTSTNTIKVPTLRLTYKTANPVKIVLYRWSLLQQSYYQVTSLTAPTMNDLTIDSVTITDTAADATILGNSLIYTTGGVLENVAPPASAVTALFKSRLFLVDAEDRNLLWYSKQVLQGTPVEMSDLQTIYVAPTTAAQGDTGPMTALGALDDKLIIFKKNAIYYIAGTGPDATGANNDFSEPVFVTSTVGCDNQNSIVFMPNGLMFQSDKGIWLIDRNLLTTYLGAPVEAFNSDRVLSALNIPGTNQVRFTLSSGTTLMYDYYYGQWGSFEGIDGISSTLWESLHTFINDRGEVYQESEGEYLDGSIPVNISFTTGWMNVGGLQGFERAYFFYILGQYFTPHRLTVGVAYDYNSSVTQSTVITPNNYAGTYGSDTIYGGGSPYGGPGDVEQWRIFFERQKCQAFQISVTESFDSSLGAAAGQGLTISGLNLIVGIKGSYPRLGASVSVG